MRDLLLATTNLHKLEEFRAIFTDLPYRILSPQDIGCDLTVEETGTTFRENAALKAHAYAQASNLLSLADDSGLEIDALGGDPGVYSARFAGENTPYEERFRIIYDRLSFFSTEQWTARFRCVIVIAEPGGFSRAVEGSMEGVIAEKPSGTHGFGYDPILFIPSEGMTSAELAPERKNQISHRGRAAAEARSLLMQWPSVPNTLS